MSKRRVTHPKTAALITGGAKGIGLGCSLELTRSGEEHILLTDTDEAALALAKQRIECMGTRCTTFVSNFFDEEARVELLQEIQDIGLYIRVLISNPYSSIRKPILKLNLSEFQEVLNNVLVSHFHMAQITAGHMVKHQIPGRLIFISSVYGTSNRPGSVAYDTGKAGLENMMRVFARELAQHGITANAIAPGYTNTPGERRFATEEEMRAAAHRTPLGRLCTPEEIGQAAVFLANMPAATGTILRVDGGIHLDPSCILEPPTTR